jgi:hypothetical protein
MTVINFWHFVQFRFLDESKIKEVMERLEADRPAAVVVVVAADMQDR